MFIKELQYRSQSHYCHQCNIPLWRTYKTYSLRTLARKWSGLYDDKTFLSLWCVSYMTGCFYYIDEGRCCWLSFSECAGFRTLRMQRHRWNFLGLRIESGSGLFELFHLRWYCFILMIYIDFMICCWHDLTWWLMMQTDDSLPTRLTYGVKGPHTISREIEGEVWTTALPQPTNTPAVARTVG